MNVVLKFDLLIFFPRKMKRKKRFQSVEAFIPTDVTRRRNQMAGDNIFLLAKYLMNHWTDFDETSRN